MQRISLGLAALGAAALAGCTAMDVVSLPVKVAKTGVNATSAAVDAATTSQAEADQKRGREIRKREEKLGELQRDYARLAAECTRARTTPAARRSRSGARWTACRRRCRSSAEASPGSCGQAAARRNLSLMARPMPSSGTGATAILARGAASALCRQS